MAELEPRLARAEEAAAILALVREAYARWVPVVGREPLPMLDDYAERIAADQAFVVTQPDGALLGVLVLENQPDAVMIENVALRTAAQGQGRGRLLLAFAEAEARRRGHRIVRLTTNALMEANIRLYAGLGYAETDRVTLEPGFVRVYMEKRLS